MPLWRHRRNDSQGKCKSRFLGANGKSVSLVRVSSLLGLVAVVAAARQFQSSLRWVATFELSPYGTLPQPIPSQHDTVALNATYLSDDATPDLIFATATPLEQLHSGYAPSHWHTHDSNQRTNDDEPPEFVFVNCAAATLESVSPSLTHCQNVLRDTAAVDETIFTVVSRVDLFPRPGAATALPNDAVFGLSALQPYGNLHFYPRPRFVNASTSSTHSTTHDIEWFIAAVVRQNTFAYYERLAGILADAYHCTIHGTNVSCPTAARTVPWRVPRRVRDDVASVVYPSPTDPASTPAVGLVRYAFAELKTGRLLLHIPRHSSRDTLHGTTSNGTTSNGTASNATMHRHVLIQPNLCGNFHELAQTDTYAPFPLSVTSTTTVAESGACRTFDRAIVITAAWSAEYYHVVVEQLPRLLLVYDFVMTQDTTIPIVVTKPYKRGATPVLHHLLHLWGLQHRVVYLNYGCTVYADTMYIPEPTPCLSLQPYMAQAHRRAIRRVVQQHHNAVVASSRPQNDVATDTATPVMTTDTTLDQRLPPPSDCIIIRRRKSRYLRNHDDLVTALSSAWPNETWHVFDEDDAPGLGVPQWSIFGRAKLVVWRPTGPDGAIYSLWLRARTWWNSWGCRQGGIVLLALVVGIESQPSSFAHGRCVRHGHVVRGGRASGGGRGEWHFGIHPHRGHTGFIDCVAKVILGSLHEFDVQASLHCHKPTLYWQDLQHMGSS